MANDFGSDGHPDELRSYVLRAFGQGTRMTLLEMHRKNPKYSWTVFVNAVSHLVSEGYLQGKGDGFAVQYLLTKKGRNWANLMG